MKLFVVSAILLAAMAPQRGWAQSAEKAMTSVASTPGASSQEAEQAAILAFVEAENAAWNAGNADAFAAHVLPNVVFTNIVGRFSIGKAPFVAQHARILSTVYKSSRLHQTLAHVTFVRPDVAIVDTIAEVSGYVAAPPGIAPVDGVIRTRLEQVMVRQDGGWWVASFHNVAVSPTLTPIVPPP